MPDTNKYSASLTGEPFLFYEIKQIAKLKMAGLINQQIQEEVKIKNLFQYATEKSVQRRLWATMKRLQILDEPMLRYMIEKPSETARIINLYAIMESNRLVHDFITQVIGEKFDSNSLILEKRDINEFFVAKREQNDEVARWKDSTVKKLKQVLLKILVEAGILDSRDNSRLHKLNLDQEVINHFDVIGEYSLLKAMGINI